MILKLIIQPQDSRQCGSGEAADTQVSGTGQKTQNAMGQTAFSTKRC